MGITWKAVERYHQPSEQGYIVSAVRGEAGVVYEAWGPQSDPALSYWKWAEKHLTRVRYAVGQAIPQRREYLGASATAEGARALCEARWSTSAPGLAALVGAVSLELVRRSA